MATVPELPEELRARYQVRRVLGQGGFGRVLLARDRELDRPVALKLLEATGDPDFLRRFRREAQVTSHLAHPGIVQVFDYGHAGDRPFIVYEYLEGKDLGALVRDTRPAPEVQVAWGIQVAEALAVVHAAGILHRDIKPANLLTRPSGEAVLCDFGIARHDAGGPALTAEGVILGTPAFMAPELLLGAAPSEASDQFSLAATLFWLACGRPVYGSEQPHEVFDRARTGGPLRVPAGAMARPSGYPAVLERALARQPAQRFADVAAFGAALAALGRGGVPAPPRPTRHLGALPAGPATVGVPGPGPSRRRRWAAGGPALLGVLLLGAILGGGHLLREPRPPVSGLSDPSGGGSPGPAAPAAQHLRERLADERRRHPRGQGRGEASAGSDQAFEHALALFDELADPLLVPRQRRLANALVAWLDARAPAESGEGLPEPAAGLLEAVVRRTLVHTAFDLGSLASMDRRFLDDRFPSGVQVLGMEDLGARLEAVQARRVEQEELLAELYQELGQGRRLGPRGRELARAWVATRLPPKLMLESLAELRTALEAPPRSPEDDLAVRMLEVFGTLLTAVAGREDVPCERLELEMELVRGRLRTSGPGLPEAAWTSLAVALVFHGSAQALRCGTLARNMGALAQLERTRPDALPKVRWQLEAAGGRLFAARRILEPGDFRGPAAALLWLHEKAQALGAEDAAVREALVPRPGAGTAARVEAALDEVGVPGPGEGWTQVWGRLLGELAALLARSDPDPEAVDRLVGRLQPRISDRLRAAPPEARAALAPLLVGALWRMDSMVEEPSPVRLALLTALARGVPYPGRARASSRSMAHQVEALFSLRVVPGESFARLPSLGVGAEDPCPFVRGQVLGGLEFLGTRTEQITDGDRNRLVSDLLRSSESLLDRCPPPPGPLKETVQTQLPLLIERMRAVLGPSWSPDACRDHPRDQGRSREHLGRLLMARACGRGAAPEGR